MLGIVKSALRKNPHLYSMAQFLKLQAELLPRRFGYAVGEGNQVPRNRTFSPA